MIIITIKYKRPSTRRQSRVPSRTSRVLAELVEVAGENVNRKENEFDRLFGLLVFFNFPSACVLS